MSQALTLARPYARAAFALAREGDSAAAWTESLTFASRIAADPSVAALLGNPQLAYADAVALLSPDAASEQFRSFLELLADNRRLSTLPEIAGLFAQLRADDDHIVKAKVTSAAELPAGELDTIRAALVKRFGREVDVETAVDDSLIGGAIIDAGDVVIDGSLRGKLARLQTALAG